MIKTVYDMTYPSCYTKIDVASSRKHVADADIGRSRTFDIGSDSVAGEVKRDTGAGNRAVSAVRFLGIDRHYRHC